jgi:hypothetical protein
VSFPKVLPPPYLRPLLCFGALAGFGGCGRRMISKGASPFIQIGHDDQLQIINGTQATSATEFCSEPLREISQRLKTSIVKIYASGSRSVRISSSNSASNSAFSSEALRAEARRRPYLRTCKSEWLAPAPPILTRISPGRGIGVGRSTTCAGQPAPCLAGWQRPLRQTTRTTRHDSMPIVRTNTENRFSK